MVNDVSKLGRIILIWALAFSLPVLSIVCCHCHCHWGIYMCVFRYVSSVIHRTIPYRTCSQTLLYFHLLEWNQLDCHLYLTLLYLFPSSFLSIVCLFVYFSLFLIRSVLNSLDSTRLLDITTIDTRYSL